MLSSDAKFQTKETQDLVCLLTTRLLTQVRCSSSTHWWRGGSLKPPALLSPFLLFLDLSHYPSSTLNLSPSLSLFPVLPPPTSSANSTSTFSPRYKWALVTHISADSPASSGQDFPYQTMPSNWLEMPASRTIRLHPIPQNLIRGHPSSWKELLYMSSSSRPRQKVQWSAFFTSECLCMCAHDWPPTW